MIDLTAPKPVLPNGHAYTVGPLEFRWDLPPKHIPARRVATVYNLFAVFEYEDVSARDEYKRDRRIIERWEQDGRMVARWF